MNKTVTISTEFIRLDALLKLAGLVDTGGEAKLRIQSGKITVNGEVCTQRGRKMRAGDTAGFDNVAVTVKNGAE